jgi:hypothetical protein
MNSENASCKYMSSGIVERIKRPALEDLLKPYRCALMYLVFIKLSFSLAPSFMSSATIRTGNDETIDA